MIAVHFKKSAAESVIDAIKTGKPIPSPSNGQWSQLDMLNLAGILYASVLSHGPLRKDGIPVKARDM
jgi:hypothetical protein